EHSIENISFSSLRSNQVPQMTHLSLPNSVNSSESLFDSVGVPRQVIINHQVTALQVDALSSSISRYEKFYFPVLGESILRLFSFLTVHGTVYRDYRFRFPSQGSNLVHKIIQSVNVFCEYD